MITEKELIDQIKDTVLTLFNNTGSISIIKIRENTSTGIMQLSSTYIWANTLIFYASCKTCIKDKKRQQSY